MYNNNQFLAAQSLFGKIKEESKQETIKSDCSYYIANCAVRLNQQDADQLMEEFVTLIPPVSNEILPLLMWRIIISKTENIRMHENGMTK